MTALPHGIARLSVRTEPLPVTGEFPPLFALMGAHGGAGVSTLATMWAPAADTGRCWPTSPRTTRRVLVVAREHMSGIAAAADVLRAAHEDTAPPGVQVCGLITVAAEPGRASKDVLRYARTVAELAPHSYRVPWVKALIPLLHRQLPTWRPADGVKATRASSDGVLASVPSAIAAVGQQICDDLAADRAAAHSEPSSTVA
ncbi:DUF6668 family protein [Gordonia sp. IITR100]|uniref:DUF6668 family protein n=1 Tax=Gordonia sp. IITR100 TaxID=1314686 RepID=UPI000990F395|nr:DUF6668 family protein [Gordonia sp. IITR100]